MATKIVFIPKQPDAILDIAKSLTPPGFEALRAEGVQIMNRAVRVGNDNDVLLHRHAVIDWDEHVGRALRESGAAESDIGWFTTLGLVPGRFQVGSGGNSMWVQYQNILAEKLERLQQIVSR